MGNQNFQNLNFIGAMAPNRTNFSNQISMDPDPQKRTMAHLTKLYERLRSSWKELERCRAEEDGLIAQVLQLKQQYPASQQQQQQSIVNAYSEVGRRLAVLNGQIISLLDTIRVLRIEKNYYEFNEKYDFVPPVQAPQPTVMPTMTQAHPQFSNPQPMQMPQLKNQAQAFAPVSIQNVHNLTQAQHNSLPQQRSSQDVALTQTSHHGVAFGMPVPSGLLNVIQLFMSGRLAHLNVENIEGYIKQLIGAEDYVAVVPLVNILKAVWSNGAVSESDLGNLERALKERLQPLDYQAIEPALVMLKGFIGIHNTELERKHTSLPLQTEAEISRLPLPKAELQTMGDVLAKKALEFGENLPPSSTNNVGSETKNG